MDYVEAPLGIDHIRASAAIPAIFPAVRVGDPPGAAGWYFDGGTRLNTPIKPALALGADRVIVLALDSLAAAPAGPAEEGQPDAIAGTGQFLQGLLVDPVVHDVRTLARMNQLAAEGGAGVEAREIPYIVIAPERRDAIGAAATRVFDEHYAKLTDLLRLRDLAILGRAVGGGSDPVHGNVLSLLFFAPEFAAELIKMGRADAERWLAGPHDDGPWQLGPLA
jgi:NTE family protein